VETSCQDQLTELAKSGKISPPDIVDVAGSLGFKVTLYSELTESQAKDVLVELGYVGTAV